MSFLYSDFLPPPPDVTGDRQVDPGTVGLTSGGQTSGFCHVVDVGSNPRVSVEHFLIRPGFSPTPNNPAQLAVHSTQYPSVQAFFDGIRAQFPTEESDFIYDAVLCQYTSGVPNGGVSGGAATVKARVMNGGALRGFVYVHPTPSGPGQLAEHWALNPSYQPPGQGVTVQFSALVPGADDDVINASTAAAFLKAMHARQGQGAAWTWVKGTVTRSNGIPG